MRWQWAIESEKMGSIYEDSTLTIFAATCRGSTDGFLKTANQLQPKPKTLRAFPKADSRSSVWVARREVEEEDFWSVENQSALSQRGWAYQESVLSRRSLYFGARQLYWKCLKGFDSLEGLFPLLFSYQSSVWAIPSGIHGHLEINDKDTIQRHYYEMVSEYSKRDLTYSKDKLPAFSGLAGRYRDAFDGEYLAGLWSTDFHRGLLWSLRLSPPSSSCSAVHPYRAPSWSWASVDGWIACGTQQPETFLRLHSWHVRPLNTRNPYGEVNPFGGADPCGDLLPPSVTVSAPTMPFVRGNKCSHPDEETPPPSGTVRFDVLEGLEELAVSQEIYITIVEDAYMVSKIYDRTRYEQEGSDMGSESPYEYLALAVSGRNGHKEDGHTVLAVLNGLVLRKSGGAFRRVGQWGIRYEDKDWNWKGWKSQTLRLI